MERGPPEAGPCSGPFWDGCHPCPRSRHLGVYSRVTPVSTAEAGWRESPQWRQGTSHAPGSPWEGSLGEAERRGSFYLSRGAGPAIFSGGAHNMTEIEWLECSVAESMLVYLGSKASPQGRDQFGLITRRLLQYLSDESSDRKLRFLTCACCRRIWDLLKDERSRQAVETSERYADGLASKKELATARAAAQSVGPYAAERA